MTYHIDPDWWKNIFDETYLLTDARSVRDDDVTKKEVELLLETLNLTRKSRILDLCGGQGRHSLDLSKRGFLDCTVFDYSHHLIEMGKSEASREGAEITFIQGDARKTGLPSSSFDAVLILGNSLGYIPNPEGDREILQESFRLLKGGGIIAIDITNGNYAKTHFKAEGWHEVDEDIVVCRRRKLKGEMVLSREIVMSKTRGIIRDTCYSIRVHEPEELESLIHSAVFTGTRIVTEFSPHGKDGDYGFMNWRMIGTGQKP